MFILCFSCNGCQLSFLFQIGHLLKRKYSAVVKTELLLYFLIKHECTTKCNSSKITTGINIDSQQITKVILRLSNISTFVSSIYSSSRQVKVQIEKSILLNIIYEEKLPTLAGKNTLLSISSLIRRVFSIFRR